MVDVADKLGQPKFAILSYSSSSDSVFVVIATRKELSKLPKAESNLRIIEINYGTREEVDGNNGAKVLPADEDASTALEEEDVSASANGNATAAPIDGDAPRPTDRNALISVK